MEEDYVNRQAQANGDHEVHHEDCSFLPSLSNRKNLGSHYSCHGAVKEAKKTYPKANGCYYCCRECHTG